MAVQQRGLRRKPAVLLGACLGLQAAHLKARGAIGSWCNKSHGECKCSTAQPLLSCKGSLAGMRCCLANMLTGHFKLQIS